MGLFGGRYVLGVRGMKAPELRLLKAGRPSVYRNEAALPRAYLVPTSRVVIISSPAFAAIKRPDFDPWAEVVIESEGPDRAPGPLAEARATIVHETPDHIIIQADAERPAWLVLSDAFGPDWTAMVGGKVTTVFRANALVWAVPLPGGRQQVELRYVPTSLRVGAWISLAALLFTFTLLSLPPSSKRQSLHQR